MDPECVSETGTSSSTPPNQQPVEVELQEITTETPSEPRAQPSPNRPREDLLRDREQYNATCVPLYDASLKGDWEKASCIIDEHPDVIRSSITYNCETALHIAASAKSTNPMVNFVCNLVGLMTSEDLRLQNNNGNTALHLAAAGGNVSIAEILVGRNGDLLNIANNNEMLPLYIAALYRKKDMVNYLYRKSNRMGDPTVWTPRLRGWVLDKCVEADFFDIAVTIVTHRPELAISGDVLRALARKTEAFSEMKPHFIRRVSRQIIHDADRESDAIQLLTTIWDKIMIKPREEVDMILRGQADEIPTSHVRPRTYSSRVLFIAAEKGNTKFIVELIRKYPDLIWKLDDRNQSIFHIAVSYRHEGIYNLMGEIGSMKDFITSIKDTDGNTMLHLAAKSAKKKRLEEISGVAQQMQRELLWYKEVERILPPYYQEKKNNAGKLPHELFTKEHKDLMVASEKWMKDTAHHCMVVAALIVTVVFAAAFTVPGGYDNKDGTPILRGNKAFIIFVISDAISLTFATISIFMFLSILTSRYAEQDFLESLPKKLRRGLATLFFSLCSMMIAFSVSFFALYDHKSTWVPGVITLFASMPVILYVRLHDGFVADVYHSTYGSKTLFKTKKPMLY